MLLRCPSHQFGLIETPNQPHGTQVVYVLESAEQGQHNIEGDLAHLPVLEVLARLNIFDAVARSGACLFCKVKLLFNHERAIGFCRNLVTGHNVSPTV